MNLQQTPLVLIFTTAYLPDIGGAELAIDQITKRIPSLRFLIFTARMHRSRAKSVIQKNIEIRRLGFASPLDKWLLPLFAFFAGLRVMRNEKRVVLWGMMVSQGTLAAYVLKKVSPQTPFIVTLQEGDSETHIERGRAGLIAFFWRHVLQAATRVTAISEYLAGQAVIYGSRKDVKIIPNGVDEHFVSESFEKTYDIDLRQELSIPPDHRVILSVSRLVEKNGLFELIDAFQKLITMDIRATLVLIGSGESEAALKIFARKRGVLSHIRFIGTVPHEELPRYYHMSDVFARPSRSEGLGSAFLEAMGSGVPVVATSVGGIPDIIEDGVTGLLVEPKNPDAVREAIAKLLSDETLYRNIRTRARGQIIDRYLWVDIAREMEHIFRSHI